MSGEQLDRLYFSIINFVSNPKHLKQETSAVRGNSAHLVSRIYWSVFLLAWKVCNVSRLTLKMAFVCICWVKMLSFGVCLLSLQIWFSMESNKIHPFLWWCWVPWLPSLRWRTKPEQLRFSFYLLWLHLWNWQGKFFNVYKINQIDTPILALKH